MSMSIYSFMRVSINVTFCVILRIVYNITFVYNIRNIYIFINKI